MAGAEQVLFGSAAAAAAMICHREISSRELTRLVLDRIDAANPGLNAVAELRREAALREAAAADQAIARGEPTGPLHGVPMTIKEAFNVAGLHTTWGNPAFREFTADRDAAVVRRLRRSQRHRGAAGDGGSPPSARERVPSVLRCAHGLAPEVSRT